MKEVNIGKFDLVDGIAYPSAAGGTLVFVIGTPIASPVLVGSACPFIQAKALSLLSNAGFSEVTLDNKGHPKSFAAGTPFHGCIGDRRLGGPNWQTTLKLDADRAAAATQTGTPESSSICRCRARRSTSSATAISNRTAPRSQYVQADGAVGEADLREAARRGAPQGSEGRARAMGFDAKQTMGIRGLGEDQIRGEGSKAFAGKKYWNDYYLDTCGTQLA